MNKFRLIIGLTVLMFAFATVQAKIGDTFVVDNMTFNVLSENTSNNTGTVSVKASSAQISGDVAIASSYVFNNITYRPVSILKDAFSKCSAMTSITIPPTVATVGNGAFYGCTSLERVNIEDLDSWLDISFDFQTANPLFYAHRLFINGEEVFDLVIPEGLSQIKKYAFAGFDGMRTLSISSTINYIGIGAFQKCNGLTSLEIPSNVTQVDQYAFGGCSQLADLTINEGVEVLGMYPYHDRSDGKMGVDYGGVFEGCTAIKEVLLPSTMRIVSRRMFYGCSALEKVTLPETIEQIFYRAFWGCSKLESINLPNGLFWIDGNAFEGCKKLTEINIPASVIHIGGSAFESTGLTSIVFPEGIDTIAQSVCYSCDLREVYIPSSVKTIRPHAFAYNENLESITIPDGVVELGHNLKYGYGGMLEGCKKIRMIKIPNSVKQIGAEFVLDCNRLTHITLPTWIEYFGDYVMDCYDNPSQITEITFPKGVEVKETYYDEDDEEDGRPMINHIFVIGDEIDDNMTTVTKDRNVTIYVKKSVFNDKYPSGQHNNVMVDYRIPLPMANASGEPIEYKTLCRDFDVDLSHTNDNLPEGVRPLRAYVVEDVDGEMRLVFLNELKYIPSRLKANATDEYGNLYQGVDEYVGVLLRGTPGYTYYYEMGEHDYTQGAWGQWNMDDAMAYSGSSFFDNLMAGDANDDFYIHKTVLDDNDEEIVNYGLNNNRFKKYRKDGWLTYNKSYLQLPKHVSDTIESGYDAENGANLTLVFNNADGTTDRVSAVEFERNSESDIFYNPYGQRVKADAKGIVISNGKKVVNK